MPTPFLTQTQDFSAELIKRRSVAPISYELAPSANIVLFTVASSMAGARHALNQGGMQWFDCIQRGVRLVPAGSHYRCDVEPFEQFDYLMARIEPSLIEECTMELDLPANRSRLSPITQAKPVRTVSAILDMLAHDHQRRVPLSRFTQDAYARLLTRALVGAMPPGESKAGLHPAAVRRVRAFMDERFAEDISISDLAQTAGTSRWHFSRAFFREIGLTPKQYLMKKRLDEASVLVRSGQMTIGDVSKATGFTSQSHMARAFRQAHGVSPSVYRRG